MNKIYRVIYNHATQTWTAVSELAKGRTKIKSERTGRTSIQRTVLSLSILASLSMSHTVYGATVLNNGTLSRPSTNPGAIEISDNGTSSQRVLIGSEIKTGGIVAESGDANQHQLVAIGNNINVQGRGAVAIGGDDAGSARGLGMIAGINFQDAATESGNFNSAGYRSLTVYGQGAVGIGTFAISNGKGATAVGLGSTASVEGSTAVGTLSFATGSGSTAFGLAARSAGSNTLAVGSGARAELAGSVALGAGSVTSQGVEVTAAGQQYNINGQTYDSTTKSNFDVSNVVSVGNETVKRQIQNVAPGQITATSTDAINGAQLYDITKGVQTIINNHVQNINQSINNSGFNLKNNNTQVKEINKDDSLNFNNGTHTTATVSAAGDVQINVNTQNINVRNGVPSTTGTVGLTTAQTVVDAIKNSGFNLQANGLEGSIVKPGDVVNFVDGNNVQIEKSGNTITINAEKSIVTTTSDLTVTPTVDNGSDTTTYQVGLSDATKNQIAQGVAAKNAVDNTGLTFAGNTGTSNVRKLGDAVDIKGADSNIQTTGSGNGVSIALNRTLNLDKATFGNVVIDKDSGINAGNKRIQGVANATAGTDAVNLSQLNASKVDIVQGANISSITKNATPNGTTYTINAKDTSASVSNATGSPVTVTKGIEANGVTDFVVDLTTQAKTSLAKADTALQNVNGKDGITATKQDDTVTVGLDDNTKANLTKANTAVQDVKGQGGITATKGNDNIVTVDLDNATKANLTKADTAVQTIVNKVNGQAVNTLNKTANEQNFITGDNIELTNENGAIKVATKQNVSFTDVKTNTLTTTGTATIGGMLNANGGLTVAGGQTVNMGNNVITNVASGGDTGTNAANIDDVKRLAAVADTTASTSGTNGIEIVKTTVNGKTTDYQVGLTKAIRDEIAKGQEALDAFSQGMYAFDGDSSTTTGLMPAGSNITFTGGSNIITTATADTGIEIALEPNIVVDNVTVGTVKISQENGINAGDKVITGVKNATQGDQAVNLSQLNATKVSVVGGANITSVDAQVTDNGTTYTINAKDTSATVSTANDKALKVTAGTPSNGITDFALDLGDETKASLKKADTAVQEVTGTNGITASKTATGYNVTLDDNAQANLTKANTAVQEIKTSVNGQEVKTLNQTNNTQNFIDGDNIVISNDSGSIKVATAKQVNFDTVTVGTASIDKDTGINAGNQTIKGVANATTNDEAVNLAQLKAQSVTLKAGQNVNSVNEVKTADGITYTIDAKDTTVSAVQGSPVTVSKGAETNGVTDYAVDLTEQAKASLAKADSAVQEIQTQIDGKAVKTLNQTNNTQNFITGDNIELTNENGAIKVATKQNVSFTDVKTNTLTTTGTATIGGMLNANGGLTVAGGQTVNMGNNVITNVASGGDTGTNAANIDDVKRLAAVADTTASTSGTNGIEIVKTTVNGKTTDYQVGLTQATRDDIAKGVQANTDINTKGLTFTGDTGSTNTKKLGDTLAITGDDNIITTASEQGVAISLNRNLTADSLSIGNVLINNAGINAGNQTIKGVANATTNDEAVNLSQLKANTTNIVAGSNITSINKTQTADGTTYTINAKDTSATVSTASNALTVKAGEQANGVTDYVIDLSDETKASLTKANTGVQTVNGKDGITTTKQGDTVTVGLDEASKASLAKADTAVQVVNGNNGITATKTDNGYDVELDETTKANLTKANTAIQEIKTSVNGQEVKTLNQTDNTQNFIDGDNISITNDNGNIKVATKQNVSFTDVKTDTLSTTGDVSVGGKLAANGGLEVASGQVVSLGNNRVQGVADGVADGDAVNVGQLNNTKTQLTNLGLDFTGNTGQAHRNLGDQLAITGEAITAGNYSGANIKTIATDAGIAIEFAENPVFKDITATSIQTGDNLLNAQGLTIGKTSITNDAGINAGNQTIKGVTNATSDNEAVNLSQLKANTTTVVAGENINSIEKIADADGITYTINAKDTTVSATSTHLVVNKGEENKGITDYAIDLSQETKDSLNKADNSLQEIETQLDGQSVKTLNKNDNIANFVTGDNMQLTAENGAIKVATKKEVSFDKVDTTTLSAKDASIKNVQADDIVSVNLSARTATINNLTSMQIATGDIKAATGNITTLTANTINANTIRAKSGDFITLSADNAQFDTLQVNQKANIGGMLNANGGLTVATGQTVNMGGNRIQGVANATNATDAVNLSQLNATKVSVVGGANITSVDAQVTDNGTTYTINAKDTSATVSTANDKALKVTAGTPSNGITDFALDLGDETKASLKKADTAVQEVTGTNGITASKTATGYNVTLDDNAQANLTKANTAVQEIKTSVNGQEVKTLNQTNNTQNFIDGDNIVISNDSGSIKVATAKQVNFDTVTVGTASIDKDTGINAGNQTIKGVANATTNDEAVNLAQLKAQSVTLKAGQNVNSVNEVKTADGITYTIDAKDTTVSAVQGSPVTVSKGAETNGVTDYAVDLTEQAKASLAKADSAVQEIQTQIDGKAVKTLNQTNNTQNFITGDNIELTNENGAIKVATKQNVSFTDVKTNTLTTTGTATIGGMLNANGGLTVAGGQTVNMGNNVITNVASGGDTGTNAANIDDVKRLAAVADTTASTSGTNGIEIVKTTVNGKTTDYQVGLTQATRDDIAKGVQANTDINTKGLTFTGDTGSTNTKKLGDTLAITGDDNIITTASEQGVAISLNRNLTADSLSIGNVLINNAGINAGNQTIKGVANATTNDEAVNLSQLKANTTNIVAGSNITSINKTQTADGTTYTINAKDTSATVSTASNALTVKAGEQANGVTDYVIDLSDETKASLTKANTGVQTVNGKDGITTTKQGDTVTVGLDEASKASLAKADTAVQVVNGNNGITATKTDNGYDVELDETTKANLTKANTAIQEIKTSVNGQEVKTLNQTDNTQNFIDGDNISITNDNGNIKVATKQNVSFTDVKTDTLSTTGDVSVGGKLAANGGLEVASGQVVSLGNNRVQGVADGVADGDAVNVAQLNNATKALNDNLNTAVSNAGWTVKANGDDGQKVANNGKVNFVQGNNIIIERSGTDITVKTTDNPDFKQVTAQSVEATTVNATTVTATTLNATTVNTDAINAKSVQADTIKTTGDVSVGGQLNATGAIHANGGITVAAGQPINMGNNVVNGVAPAEISASSTQAVNGAQIYELQQGINRSITSINERLYDVEQSAYAGTASAIATGLLPQAFNPGESLGGVAIGTYKGTSAVSVGYSQISDNGKYIFKFAGGATSTGDYSGGAAFGVKFR
ncbi:ESPR-type extended signal peptide-containing protein [Moraxella nasicaprae]|uniref:YadA-like family protein n=1 Tax=Moraxella nasicaprae TaxID=2904122 RepID=A0ABY6F4V4_9GAMM|nr:ESPR-type extended signal peptide-containing protein [Moraxella nasicaprae]UXZ05012.1 YadA-like family protein [Moraxella nasicaprae]